MKKAFTLAEIMIVLTVIGILAAILMPMAFQAAPDENIMKFKKANSTIGTVVRELTNSDKYYNEGDLGVRTGTDGAASATIPTTSFFCETLGEVLSYKTKNCNTSFNVTATSLTSGSNGVVIVGTATTAVATAKTAIDSACTNTANLCTNSAKTVYGLVTADGVSWCITKGVSLGAKDASNVRLFAPPDSVNPKYKDANGFDAAYRVICIDVDGFNNGEAPFGYGIRADGKILPGARADAWVVKSVQGN